MESGESWCTDRSIQPVGNHARHTTDAYPRNTPRESETYISMLGCAMFHRANWTGNRLHSFLLGNLHRHCCPSVALALAVIACREYENSIMRECRSMSGQLGISGVTCKSFVICHIVTLLASFSRAVFALCHSLHGHLSYRQCEYGNGTERQSGPTGILVSLALVGRQCSSRR